jgi:c-di-GMP-binding flagellar brake protein YcgR
VKDESSLPFQPEPGWIGPDEVAGTRTRPERRINERYEIDTELTATLLPERRKQMHGRSLDISIAGIAGVFATGWELGTRVLIEFFVPVAHQQLKLEAIVRNRNGHRYGFEFVNVGGRDRVIIDRTLSVLAVLR